MNRKGLYLTAIALPFSLTAATLSVGALASDTDLAATDASGHSAGFAAVQAIFDENCVVCHQTDVAEDGLVLEAGKSFASVVGKRSRHTPLPLVEPGAPEHSYLLDKLADTHVQKGGSGARMPLGGELDQASIAKIRSWIEAGAKQENVAP